MNDTKPNDGGPAFPRTKSTGDLSNSTTEIISVGGMSLRDYFAGQALTGLLADQKRDGSLTAYADDAYAFADAMIAARNS